MAMHLSLSAVQADNFYVPPGWDPSKESLKKFVGAKGANQFEQLGIIRLELPFDCWCDACSRHMAKGTRFNAKKDAAGKYYTTQLWRFSMCCPACKASLVLETDPQQRDYKCSAYLRRKVETYDAPDAPTTDLMAQLEKEEVAKRGALAALRSSMLDDDSFAANSLLRSKHRAKRKADDALDAKAKSLGLAIRLQPLDDDDEERAKNVAFLRHNKKRETSIFKATSRYVLSFFLSKDQ